MDATSIADNTTVVGGPSSTVNRKELSHHQYDFSKPSSNGVPENRAPNDFVRAPDFTMQDRQFFVTIAADGLIGALQKLDKQLKAVSICHTVYATTEY